MTGPHGDVGHAEVEEGLRGFQFVQFVQSREVVVEGGLQGTVQQVLHREVLRVVGAGSLARTRSVVQVDGALSNGWLFAFLAGPVGVFVLALGLNGQVRFGDGQFGLQQTFIDGSELTHSQRAEVDRTKDFLFGWDEQEML